MSSSELVLLVVEAPPTTEVVVSDNRLRVLETRHGGFTAALRPGVYGLRFRALGLVQYIDVVLPAAVPEVRVEAPEPAFATSAPLNDTLTTHEWHRYPAVDASRKLRPSDGQGLLAFVREVAVSSSPEATLWSRNPRWRYEPNFDGWAPSNPAIGLSIHTDDGVAQFMPDAVAQSQHRASVARPMKPGWCVVRVTRGDGSHVEMPIVIASGWFTQLFVTTTPTAHGAVPDLGSATIFLSRDPEFRPDHPGRRLEALLQEAMRGGRRPPDLAQLLDQQRPWIEHDGPLLGLCLGHMLLRDREVSPGTRERVAELARVLEAQLGRHPDVLALQLAAEPARRLRSVQVPPMLAASWRVLIEASYRQPHLIRPGSTLDAIAEYAASAGPWLMSSNVGWAPVRSGGLGRLQQVVDLLDYEPIAQRVSTPRLSRIAQRIVHAICPAVDPAVRVHYQRWGIDARPAALDAARLGVDLCVPACTLDRGLVELHEMLVAAAGGLRVHDHLRAIAQQRISDAVSLADALASATAASSPAQAAQYALFTAELSEGAGDMEQTIDAYNRVLRFDPTSTTAFTRLSQLYRLTGDAARRFDLLVARAAMTFDRELLWEAAEVASELGRQDDALHLLEQLLDASHYDDQEAFDRFIQIAVGVAEPARLARALRRRAHAVEQAQAAELLVRAGDMYRDMGDLVGARAAYADASARDSGSREAPVRLAALNASMLRDRPGYDASFLSRHTLPLPTIDVGLLAPTLDGGHVLPYEHFSLLVSANRRMSVVSALNLDRPSRKPTHIKSTSPEVIPDPRIDARFAIAGTQRPKGFDAVLTPADDVAWGDPAAIERARLDTAYTTNYAGQHGQLRRLAPYWSSAEDYLLLRKGSRDASPLCVLQGPVFRSSDPVIDNVVIPILFWKLLAWDHNGTVRSLGLMVSQETLVGHDSRALSPVQQWRVPVAIIGAWTDLTFPEILVAGDSFSASWGTFHEIASWDDLEVVHDATSEG